VKYMRQIILAMGQERYNCSVDSIESQKAHFRHTFNFFLARLSFVNMILFSINHIKVCLDGRSMYRSCAIHDIILYKLVMYF
jgi:hypothetical protein